jgi:deoxyribose-phosphate aldolase
MKWLFENIERKFTAGEITEAIAAIVKSSQGLKTRDNLELAFSCIDLTTLNSTDGQERGKLFADKVSKFNQVFPKLPNVAAICVFPTLVKTVRKNLLDQNVHVASVSAGFPSSMTFEEVKTLETRMAVEAGADEIDVVISIGEFLAGNDRQVNDEISRLKRACGKTHLKVILETGALKTPENIWRASIMAMQADADFIKTSTGKLEPAATPEAAWVMCSAIKEFYNKTGRKVGFKPAGGIVETEDALIYLAIVKEVLGEEWLNNKLFRIGASRLANNLLTAIQGTTVSYF